MKTTFQFMTAFALATIASGTTAHAALIPYWFDGFDVSQTGGTLNGGSSFDINTEIGPPRQGGPLAPTTYVTNTADPSNDFRHQLFPTSNGFQPLQLAGDGGLGGAPILASPSADFSGPAGTDVIGQRVTFSLDVASFNGGDPSNAFVNAGFTLGASSTLSPADALGSPQFGLLFIEDTIGGGGLGPFLQFYDGTSLVQNTIPNPAGFGSMDVQIDVTDPLDGDPWNGVGSSVFAVSINGTSVGVPHVFAGGGLTSNFLTMSGNRDFVSQGLATHVFDNLTVFSGPAIPEPASAALLLIGLLHNRNRSRER